MLIGHPIFRIAFQQDVAALLPLLEDERAGPDRRAAIGIGERIGALRLPTAIVQEGGYNVDTLGRLLARFLTAYAA